MLVPTLPAPPRQETPSELCASTSARSQCHRASTTSRHLLVVGPTAHLGRGPSDRLGNVSSSVSAPPAAGFVSRSSACCSAAGMLRRSAMARQPARRALSSTVVRASQRGPHPTPPIAVSEAWVAAQRAWVDLAVNQPAELSGTDAKGVAWSSSVHLLGITHNSAANARPVYEVAVAVKPDAVGSENDSSDKTARNRVTKAALSAPMMKLVLGSWTRPSKATSRHTGSSLQSSAKSGRTVGT